MFPKIKPVHHFDWDEIYRIPIVPSNEKLIDLSSIHHPKIRIQSEYFRQNLVHALPQCYVRQTVAEKLMNAAQMLPEHLHLLILDGWRPLALQQALIDLIRLEIQKTFIDVKPEQQDALLTQFVAAPSADPLCPSPHFTGGSVDLTLCDDDGKALDMGTAFDAPVEQSWTAAMEVSSDNLQAQQNRRILYGVMIRAGFTNLPSEWWHYDYGNQLWSYFSQQPYAHYTATSL